MSVVRMPSRGAARAQRVGTVSFALVRAALLLHLGVASASAQPARDDRTTQSVSLSDLVFSASRYAQDTRDAPASVTIITAKEIRDQNTKGLQRQAPAAP